MHSNKFRINTNGQSLRNPTNGFFGMTLSANDLNSDEGDLAANNDRRSAHNALERQRREHLNVKFQQLAHVLPSLQSVRRPSKTMIVAKSLEFVTSSLKRENTFTSEIQRLKEENAKLKRQAEVAASKMKIQHKKNEGKEEQMKPSLKRKANSQLSPPLTPESIPKNNTKRSISIAQPTKKRMVEQTKSPIHAPSTPIDNVNVSPPPTSTVVTSEPMSSSAYYAMPSVDQSFLFATPTSAPLGSYPMMQNSTFVADMSPMLLAPYYISSGSSFSYPSYPQVPSDDPTFYL